MTDKLSAADAVWDAVIRRPTGAAATARAAGAFPTHGGPEVAPAPMAHEAMRTTLHLHAAMRTALKRRALDQETTMGDLIRAAVNAALQDPATLARESMVHRGTGGGVRTTLDLPRSVHRALKRLAADEDTSLQALVVAALLQTYSDLCQ